MFSVARHRTRVNERRCKPQLKTLFAPSCLGAVCLCVSGCRFITQHAANKNYKAFVKALLKASAEPLNSEDAKEIENTAGTIRADKVKAEKAAAVAKKGGE